MPESSRVSRNGRVGTRFVANRMIAYGRLAGSNANQPERSMTFGISKDPRIDMHLNNGTFNGRSIYVHYTSEAGHRAIMRQRCILAKPSKERRGAAAKMGVYLALAKDAMNNRAAHHSLFLGEERYAQSATHCLVFVFNSNPHLTAQPISQGSRVSEAIHPGNIPFHRIDVIYDGRNPFI
jgi:hypothetical protein